MAITLMCDRCEVHEFTRSCKRLLCRQPLDRLHWFKGAYAFIVSKATSGSGTLFWDDYSVAYTYEELDALRKDVEEFVRECEESVYCVNYHYSIDVYFL